MQFRLKALTKGEILSQMRMCVQIDRAERVSSRTVRVVVALSDGRRDVVVRVSRGSDGSVRLGRAPDDPDILRLAPMFHSDIRELAYEEIVSSLDGLPDDTPVYVQPVGVDDPVLSRVGKVFAVGVPDGELDVFLIPVTFDIEAVNAFVHETVAEKCRFAKEGRDCGDCWSCGFCPTLKGADEEAHRRFPPTRESELNGRGRDAGNG